MKYIITVDGLEVNDRIKNGYVISNECRLGSTSNLSDLPLGTKISNVGLYPKSGGNLSRSTGCCYQILSKFQDKVLIISGIRRVLNKKTVLQLLE